MGTNTYNHTDIYGRVNCLEQMISALENEVNELWRYSYCYIKIFEGVKVSNSNDIFYYEFLIYEDIEVRDNTPIIFESGIEGEILSRDDLNKIYIKVNENLGPYVQSINIKMENSLFINQLKDHLLEIITNDNSFNFLLANYLIGLDDEIRCIEKFKDPTLEDLTDLQQLAVKQALSNNVTFIYTPPDSGKTITLSRIIEGYLNNGKTVLVVSKTNQAVENIFEKLFQQEKSDLNITVGKFIKLGTVLNAKLFDYTKNITIDQVVKFKENYINLQKMSLDEIVIKNRREIETLESILNKFKKSLKLKTLTINYLSQLDNLYDYKEEIKEELNYRYEKKKLLNEKLTKEMSFSIVRKFISSFNNKKLKEELYINEQTIETLCGDLENIEKDIDIKETLLDELQSKYIHLEHSLQAYPPKNDCEIQLESLKRSLDIIFKEKEEIERTKESIISSVVKNSKVIGTTVNTLFSFDRAVIDRGFDMVIIDEASTFMLPINYYLAGLAREKVIIAGDNSRISPAILTEDQNSLYWVNKNVFDLNNIYDLIECGELPKYIVDLSNHSNQNNINDDNYPIINEEDLTAIDELFYKTEKYRNSNGYIDLLKFIGKFKKYSPYNCMLMHVQNPNITYVASLRDWERRFQRYPTKDARPLVILRPGGPVMFLYDISDTHGKDVPVEISRPFKTDGKFPENYYKNLIEICALNGIEICFESKSNNEAGYVERIICESSDDYLIEELPINYRILINSTLEKTDQFSTIIHELGHIFCGHLGMDPLNWWDDRSEFSKDIEEIEAETIAYLVCNRVGLVTTSDKYLVEYKNKRFKKLPDISINAILKAVETIEGIGKNRRYKNNKKPKIEFSP